MILRNVIDSFDFLFIRIIIYVMVIVFICQTNDMMKESAGDSFAKPFLSKKWTGIEVSMFPGNEFCIGKILLGGQEIEWHKLHTADD